MQTVREVLNAAFGSPFGEPTLTAARNSSANWVRGAEDPLYQKGSTGWLANLYGGVQTNDDFAAVFIPVNELRIPEFKSALWSYYMSAAQSAGVNMVVWVHDPADLDIRAEITQKADTALLERGAGWNAHELDISVSQFYYYGENVTGVSLITGTGPANLFTWAQFQADARFSSLVIYRISFEYGWWASGTFDDAYVADIVLNGRQIPLKPDRDVAHLGQVGGHTDLVQDSFSRPADTTPYSIGDAVVDLTSAPTPLEWEIGRIRGGTGVIVSALLLMNSAQATKLDAHLWLFSATLVPPVDNGACDLTDAEALTFIGMVDFGVVPDVITNPTVGAGGNCCYLQRALDIAFECATTSKKIFGFLVAQNTYTPVSAETFTIGLGVLQD